MPGLPTQAGRDHAVLRKDVPVILIVDNGQEYSDHAMYFVRVDTEAERELVMAVSALKRPNTSWAYVAGEADDIRWFEAGPGTITAKEFMHRFARDEELTLRDQSEEWLRSFDAKWRAADMGQVE